jgi:hypothetical protein
LIRSVAGDDDIRYPKQVVSCCEPFDDQTEGGTAFAADNDVDFVDFEICGSNRCVVTSDYDTGMGKVMACQSRELLDDGRFMGISSESDDIRNVSSEGLDECAVLEMCQSQIENSHGVILG